MATGEKISALDTTTAQSTDLIPIARDGDNYSVTAASIAAKVTATAPIVNTSGDLTFDPTAITTSATTPLTGTEIVALSQGGVTKKTTVGAFNTPVYTALAASSGSSLVGYTQGSTNAVTTTVQAKLRESVSVFDFMTAAQIADVQAGTASLDVTTALQNAIATSKALYWPSGVYLISGTLTGIGGWYGEGQGGSAYNSTFSGYGTFIRLSGTNGGNAFLKPPLDFEGFHIDGQTKTNIGIDLGQNASFVAFQRWKRITVRRCSYAMRAYNFYSVSFADMVVQGNVYGITITPTDGPGDDGYFTATNWSNVHIADNDVYGLNVYVPQGDRTWVWTNVVIERNGATGGTYQAYLRNVTVNGYGIYIEGTSTVPGIMTNNSTLVGNDWYFNGTGGIDATTNPITLAINKLLMTSATDLLSNFPTDAKVTLSNTTMQTDLRSLAGFIAMENVYIASVTTQVNFRPKTIAIGQSPGALYQPTELRFSYAGKTTYSGTIGANSWARAVTDQYFEGILDVGCGYGGLEKYYPGLLVQITPSQTGLTNYYCVVLVNTTASPITLTAVQVNWVIFRALSVTV